MPTLRRNTTPFSQQPLITSQGCVWRLLSHSIVLIGLSDCNHLTLFSDAVVNTKTKSALGWGGKGLINSILPGHNSPLKEVKEEVRTGIQLRNLKTEAVAERGRALL